ncbi:cytochrome C oxidase subunit III [Ferrimonas sediminicola]|uniref:Cytochrome C oxidase subunit III n=1 Tax=Ferrimonas sediminicola TaxID=2569538 RepID=A0A4V5NXE6_9GAMM|nr:cytochrome c oxidase subunit 3 [Ferrimonas sediminicola]TKB48179.1 cytochrome C oxidase subunit III [Ferrimonas sediminicola]
MKLLHTLTQKPWQDSGQLPEAGAHRDAGSVGLWVALAVITSLFTLFMLSAIIRSQSPDWQPLTEQPWQPLFRLTPLWINTLVLLGSSLVMQLSCLQRRDGGGRPAVALGLALALLFLIGQWSVWQSFAEQGFGLQSGPAAGFYFLLTGLHALHLLAALLVVALILPQLWRESGDRRLRLLTRYWHYLFLIWCVLFALVSRPPATYKVLAALCGIDVGG